MIETLKAPIRKLIDVPISDPEERQRSRLLNILLLGMSFMTVISLIITALVTYIAFDENPYPFYLLITLTLVVLGFIYTLNRRSGGWLPRSLFLGFMLILVMFVDDPIQVANGRSLIAFAMPIVMAGVLFRPYASFIVAGITGLQVILMSLSLNIIPDPFTILTFFTIALSAWLIAYTMERAVNEFRVLNAQLDQRVQRRTQELASALTRERSLAERERTLAMRHETILKSIADGVLVFDGNQEIIIANPSANYMSGRNLKGVSLNQFLTSVEGKAKELIKVWIAGKKPSDINSVRFNWHNRTISANIAPVMLSNLNERHVSAGNVMVLRDFSKEAELEKAKDIFIGMISHELRTPLTAIQGFAEILIETSQEHLPEADYEFLGIIFRNARQMLGLVEELLDLSRMETGRLDLYRQWTEIPTLIDNAVKTVTPEFTRRNLNLEVKYETDELPEIYVDPTRVMQVLLNLLSNVYKYTLEGGATITISHNDQSINIAVRDTGIGIKKADQEKMFSRFFRSEDHNVQKAGGTGLGLNISKGLMELHDGELTFESTYGQGTTFTMMLPINSVPELDKVNK